MVALLGQKLWDLVTGLNVFCQGAILPIFVSALYLGCFYDI